MTALADFSFNNQMIKDYFNGSDEYVPVSELLYIHDHPLVQPNFMSEMEVMINLTAQYMMEKNIRGSGAKLISLTESLGKLLPLSSRESAAEALVLLRQIYVFCKTITGKA